MDKLRKKLPCILLLAGIVCLLAACFLLARQWWNARSSDTFLEDLRQSAGNSPENETSPRKEEPSCAPEPSSTAEPDSVTTSSAQADETDDTPEETEPIPVENPYRDSFLANEDMAAWIIIDNTVIDYPVMWTPRDENYYLHRNFKKKKDNNGCLILDTDSSLDPLTTNLIIHGHNMRSGAMFGTLLKYEDQTYCNDHRYISLCTEKCMRNYEVIAVFRSQVYRTTDHVFKFYKFFQADTEEEFDDFYQNIKALSLYDTGVTAQFGDHFLTLSTCAYHVEQGRFVVVAKEIGCGDVYLPFRDQEGQ